MAADLRWRKIISNSATWVQSVPHQLEKLTVRKYRTVAPVQPVLTIHLASLQY